jgi:hypothetical protein
MVLETNAEETVVEGCGTISSGCGNALTFAGSGICEYRKEG